MSVKHFITVNQRCGVGCCSFTETPEVSEDEHLRVKRSVAPKQGFPTIEAVIECLNVPRTKAMVEKLGFYIGIQTNRLPGPVDNPVFDTASHGYRGIATQDHVDKWKAAKEPPR